MAGEHSGDQSFYDFLIEEPEMMAPAPPGHFQHQQPISPPNRTSRDPPPRPDPTEIETHHPAHHPVLGMQLPEPSRAQSRGHLHLDLHGPPNSVAHGAHPSQSLHDLHGGVHATQGPAGFANQHPVSTGPMTIDWGLYSVGHGNLSLNPPQFDFPGAMIPAGDGTIGHQNHLSHASTDPAFAYGSELVSPSSIHSSRGHYDSTVSNHWDDALSHGASTPKVTTPAAHVTANPWAEVEEAQDDNLPAPTSRPRRTTRPRRQKKDARKTSEASQGGSSSAGGAPSVSDAPSPGSTSQNSRASIGSKSASMASTTSTASSRQSKLRSASRTSKNSRDKPNDTPEERRTRASHNLVEKQYRNRLNAQFESLLNALPEQARSGGNASGNGNGDENESDGANEADRRVSKGEVLEMARKHIQALEQERNQLERENLELQGSLRRLKGPASEGTTSSSGQQTPLDFNSNTDQDKARDDRDKD
ncbi:Allergen Fus c 3 [Fusarium sp. AF-6]|nr:Allergen Fus c 3 [Fusarium sp. AF-6]